MAIVDAEMKFCAAQAVTADAASTNVLDLGAKGPGNADRLKAEILCDVTAACGSTGGTMTVQLQVCDAADFAANVDTVASVTVPHAALVAGMKPLVIESNFIGKRYCRLYFDTSANLTAGKFTAYLQHPQVQTNR